MFDPTICGKFIRTCKNNLLVCLEIKRRNFFFAMNPNGIRFCFKHELERGNYLTRQEWDNALKTWDNAKVEELTGEELKDAKRLAPEIARNFTFLMSPDQIKRLPVNHVHFF